MNSYTQWEPMAAISVIGEVVIDRLLDYSNILI